ncbi:uncharacterized protein Bfra_003973 [Botrytis fragariae]|uniref:Uncharacterized protein n=1 Tax=Botrytis fragariae TaxID=1964551 RepID=A0A8H6EKS1_9HELO|nr:uncharacterized protein Bfra_003973 [Botrytis fragariae]KAF5875520.1 hypothetical protein Bfra_003973 [Botrytis fragariae]
MAAHCDSSDHKTPTAMNRNSTNSVKTTHLLSTIPALHTFGTIDNSSENVVTKTHQTGVYSIHTRFFDNDDSPTENEAHQPQVQITLRPVEALSRFGHLNEVSRFNTLWTKKAWTSELLTLRDRQELESIPTSRIHNTKFKFNALPVEIREMMYEYTLLRPLERKKKSASKTPVFLRALKIYGAQHLYIEAKTTFHSINQFTYNIVKTLKFADPEMFSYEHGGFEIFLTHSLPKFERLINLKVECEYGKFFTSSFVQNHDKWISLLNKMITGENGESVQGIRMGEEETSGTTPSTPTWVWKVGNEDSREPTMLVGMKRELNLVIKHRVAHVKF